MNWRRNWVAFLIFGIICLSGCTNLTPVVKIGLVGPFEGRHREIGYDVIYSARLATRQINDSGGIGKYRVALTAQDDFGDPEIAEQIAQGMVNDPQVIAVLGNWLTETSEAAEQVYHDAAIPYLKTSPESFDTFDPETLPPDFRLAYENVTPFDERPGPYAGGAFDAMQLLFEAMAIAEEKEGALNRSSVNRALDDLQYHGMTGIIEINKTPGQ